MVSMQRMRRGYVGSIRAWPALCTYRRGELGGACVIWRGGWCCHGLLPLLSLARSDWAVAIWRRLKKHFWSPGVSVFYPRRLLPSLVRTVATGGRERRLGGRGGGRRCCAAGGGRAAGEAVVVEQLVALWAIFTAPIYVYLYDFQPGGVG